jgi:hypothetical protein
MRAPIALFLAASLYCSFAFAEDTHVAIIKDVTGTVTVIRNGASIKAEPGTQLEKLDEVISSASSTGGIVFRDGTLLTLGAGSDVQIKDYVFEPKDAKYAFAVFLSKGSAIYSSGKIGKVSPESVSVQTPKAVIGVRGTRFLVTATE